MALKKRILLIEDNPEIAQILSLQAEISGFRMSNESNGLKGFVALCKEKPDLVLLDILLPGQNGLDVLRKIRSHKDLKHLPVILISCKNEELDIILGMELGADDYVCKPFSPKVLFSKIKAILRRGKDPSKVTKSILFGEFSFDIDQYQLKKHNETVSITLSEFGILKRLIANSGKVLTRNQLLDDVNNDDGFIVDRNIDVHVASLRKKLAGKTQWIETVRGVGYRFKEINPK